MGIKILYFISGLLLSAALVAIGFLITHWLGNVFWLSLFALSVPIFGIHFIRSGPKQIGIGMLVSCIPLALLATIFVVVSELH